MLQVIASSTATISELNNGIVMAADQQTAATQEVKESIRSIRANASLATDQVQSTAGAAQEMLALSQSMEESVGQFRCEDAEDVPQRPRPAWCGCGRWYIELLGHGVKTPVGKCLPET